MTVATITEFFQKDHVRLDKLFQKFRTLKHSRFEEAKECLDEFLNGLLKHIGWEEEILFPVFEDKTAFKAEGPTVVMRFEHKQIKQALRLIHQSVQEANVATDDYEGILLEVLTQHNAKEEGILYPALDELLSHDELAQILERIQGRANHEHECCCGMGI